MFKGFDRTAPQFFFELSIEQNKEWFNDNKQRYLDQWVTPMTELLTDVSAKLAKTYAPAAFAPLKLFRIHRDVRFAKDKTPYKTHISGVLRFATKHVATPLYLQLGMDDEFIGFGAYFFDDRQLAKWRKLVAADKSGNEIAALIAKFRKAGYDLDGHDNYQRVPKPFAADHPRAELLKLRGLTGEFPAMPKGLLHKPALVQWLVEHAKTTAPLVKWLSKRLA